MSTDDTLKIEADEIIVEKFPERAAGELAAFFLDTWEPGTPIEINLRELPAGLLISSFFATFMERLHKKDPKLCRAAINDITWITQHEFQRNSIQNWMEPWKKVVMSTKQGHPDHVISNIGHDEEGRKIGNCSCGAVGCDVDEHLRTVAIQHLRTVSPQSALRSRVEPRGETVVMPEEYTNVKKLRELYPEKPHDLARYDGENNTWLVEVMSYPSPPTKEDVENWARLTDDSDDVEPASSSPFLVFPQATILVRLTPGNPNSVREVPCFLVSRVPHEDDNGRVGYRYPKGSANKELKQLVTSWWIFRQLDAANWSSVSPERILGIMNEFLADPLKCDKELSKEYEEEYGPPKLT